MSQKSQSIYTGDDIAASLLALADGIERLHLDNPRDFHVVLLPWEDHPLRIEPNEVPTFLAYLRECARTWTERGMSPESEL